MNTIAAQFPELPTPSAVLERTWCATWFVGESKLDHGIEQHAVYTADQMHQYARDYAAALSQTAGVPDGWKLVPVEPTEVMCEAAMSSLGWTRSEAAAKTAPITPASPMMEGSMKVWSAMLSAAPAASGAHPDALPDGTLSKSTAKRVDALRMAQGEGSIPVAEVYEDSTGLRFPRWAPTVRQLPEPGTKLYAGAPTTNSAPDGYVLVPRELTISMREAAEQEEACGNDFEDMWEAAIATYIFDKENGNG